MKILIKGKINRKIICKSCKSWLKLEPKDIKNVCGIQDCICPICKERNIFMVNDGGHIKQY